MYIVKLTFNYDWPIFRQTPQNLGIWGDYKFVIDSNLKECDYWIIYTEYKLVKEQCICNKENIFFIPGEGVNTCVKYPKAFLSQFGKIITVQREIQGKNVVHYQGANPWFVEKTYDELMNYEIPEKKKLISIISSDKAFTPGHIKRLEFAKRIKDYFGDDIDFFGRGLNTFDRKWDTLAPYKYHIAIENDFCEDYFTEKLFDPIFANSYPFYFGCPNLELYVTKGAFTRIDINNFEESVAIIERVIKSDMTYNSFTENAHEYRNDLLNVHQLFPMVCKFMDYNRNNQNKKKKQNIIRGVNDSKFEPRFQRNRFSKYIRNLYVRYKSRIKF